MNGNATIVCSSQSFTTPHNLSVRKRAIATRLFCLILKLVVVDVILYLTVFKQTKKKLLMSNQRLSL